MSDKGPMFETFAQLSDPPAQLGGVPIADSKGNSKDRSQPADADSDALSFEDAFRMLGAMAEELETGGLSLAEATGKFEEGMKLVQRCNLLLNNAELKITQLKESYREADGPSPDSADGLVDDLEAELEEQFGE